MRLPGLFGGRATRAFAGSAFLGMLLLSGCGKFFIPDTTIPGTGTGGGGGGGGAPTTPFLYIANANTTPPTIAGFSTPGSSLAFVNNYAVGDIPTTLAITPGNNFLYAGGVNGSIFVYVINSDGSITLGNNGSQVASGISPAAMKVDSTGNWLLAADSFTSVMAVFQINSTTGALTAATNSPIALDGPGPPSHIAITPNNQVIYVSLGTTGLDIFTFNAFSGMATKAGSLSPSARFGADTGLAVNPAGTYLYMGESAGNGLRVLKIGANPALAEVSGSPYLTGRGPTAVVVDGTGTNVYVTNRTDNTISGFSIAASGALTQLAGSPYPTGINPIDMVIDSTKGYLAVVCSGGSPDLQLFNFDATTPGKLNSVAVATTGTDPTTPLAIVATH